MMYQLVDQFWSDIVSRYGSGENERVFFVLGSLLVHEVPFWGLSFMFWVFHRTGMFEKYAIRGKAWPEWKLVKTALIDLSVNHFVIQPLALYFALYVIVLKCNITFSQQLPDMSTFLWQIFAFLMINDCLFYWAHRSLHHPAWYKYIHKQHHQFRNTIGIAAEYAHPVEGVYANYIPTLGGPLLIGYYFGSHVFTLWVYLFLRVWETVESHSGYDFPWSPWSLFWWQGGADLHDYHHSHNVGNFGGGMTCLWDYFLGTDKSYREWKAKGSKQKKK